METIYIIISIFIVGVSLAGFVYYLLNKRLNKVSQLDKDSQSLVMLQNQINEINKTLDTKLTESTKMFASQRSQDAQIIREVTEKLTKLDETNKQVLNFSDQLKSLQDILKNPKQRGVLGEYYLETVLKNVLPPASFQMQYKFKNGEIVDAVIFVKDKIIPVDSKFSLENYNKIVEEHDETRRKELEKLFKQDLKNRIDETSKYVRPDEKTYDFAFMFIPSEAIYYDLLVNKIGAVKISTRDLIEYAFKDKHVIVVSPTTFMAYLQMVLQGLRALQIEESTKEIRKNVEKLGKHILNFDSYMQKLGNQLGTAVNSYNQTSKEFKKIDKDILKITGEGGEIEPLEIDKPKEE
ncbi:MAG: DNA recombination protein RmuC [Patescibacteria group bacterium]|nr:DNA recombination protein RmuC [Patescibacteria group bacterium]